jgi:hypothetical protein
LIEFIVLPRESRVDHRRDGFPEMVAAECGHHGSFNDLGQGMIAEFCLSL